MRQLKLLGIALVAILSLSITAVTAAQAETLSFLPLGAKFEFKSNGEKTFLRMLGSTLKVECASVKGTGEALSERLGLVDFLFLGCETLGGVKCTGLNDTVSGSILVHAEYHLRHLLNETGHPEDVILVILILGDGTTGSTAAHFACLGILQEVRGCVASDDLKKNSTELWLANQLVSSFVVNFLATGTNTGDPVVPSIDTDNSLGMENCTLLTEQEKNGKPEISSQQGTGTVEGCKSGGAACTFLIDLTGEHSI